jgi:flavin reductase (DIM6/NTAB) family NADH-FMN oxidoreductase RutF
VSLSAGQFRAALAKWPSGISVVTTRWGAEPAGMTVSAFFSVSLSPPLIAVCLDRRAATLALIEQSRHFAVNVLSSEQRALSDRFATRDNEPIRFDGVPLDEVPGTRSPLLTGAVVHLDCELATSHDAGDHVLCIGRVRVALTHPGAPLIYHAASYHRLTPLPDEP